MKSKSNPKAIWSHVRQKLKTKSGELENNKDLEATKFDDKEKANILQEQFSSVFTREPENDIPAVEKRTSLIIKDLIVTEEMVKRETMQLNTNKSCGPGEINPQLLIEVADIISAPLGVLMIKTLKHGNMPQDWKKSECRSDIQEGSAKSGRKLSANHSK